MPVAEAVAAKPRWSLSSYLDQKEKLKDQDVRYRLFMSQGNNEKPRLEVDFAYGLGTRWAAFAAPMPSASVLTSSDTATETAYNGHIFFNGFFRSLTGWNLPNITLGILGGVNETKWRDLGVHQQKYWGASARFFGLNNTDTALFINYNKIKETFPFACSYQVLDVAARIFLVKSLSFDGSWSPRPFVLGATGVQGFSRVAYSYGASLHVLMFRLGANYDWQKSEVTGLAGGANAPGYVSQGRSLWLGFSI